MGDRVTRVRMVALAKAIESRWPRSRVIFEPYRSPDDPLIRWWVHILGLSFEEGWAATDFGLDASKGLFGKDPIPFFLTSERGSRARDLLARLPRSGRALPFRRPTIPLRTTQARVGRGRSSHRTPGTRARATPQSRETGRAS